MSRVFSRYVHRATLGLPRQERLEAAAELRTHLMDRAARLEAEGFSREEAEHLAVKGMGDVGVTNRQLLGHVFTNRVAWAVLAVLVLGGGGWWVWQNVPLPGWGQATWRWDSELGTADLAALFEDANAPRGHYLAGQLSLPTRAEWLYITLVPRKNEGMAVLHISSLRPHPKDDNAPTTRPANERTVSRLLLGGAAWETLPTNCTRSVPQVRLYVKTLPLSPWSLGSICTGVTLPPTSQLSGWSAGWQPETDGSLTLNRWTVLAAYGVGYGQRNAKSGVINSDPWNSQHAVLFAVMPADHALHTGRKIPPGTSSGIYLETNNWKKDGSGLPRPTLKWP
ncbi:permease prefix domain 1-containing protein [Deinococcus sp. NW-56]|uniref:permease prefix domain 1-containing protein n=1 Tax=Deinococcus sp. NW-56 TaxID=2080419 RepID=UPI0018F8948E|nr:permease prefix domain 1-containing protein [Deinococcus sp. NW-56]